MRPTYSELGRRVAASKVWGWKPGMQPPAGILLVRDCPYYQGEGNLWRIRDGEIPHEEGWYPCLQDTLTYLYLREQVAMAYGGTQVLTAYGADNLRVL